MELSINLAQFSQTFAQYEFTLEILTSDLNLVGKMNANSFVSLTITNGGANVLRTHLKQIKNVPGIPILASAVQNSRPEIIMDLRTNSYTKFDILGFTELLLKQCENAAPGHDAANAECVQI